LKLAQETIQHIAELIRETVELASQIIDDALKTILEKGNDIEKEAQDTLRKLLQSVAEEIEKAKEKALEAGADISECISGQEDAAKEVIDEVTQEILACVSDKVRKNHQSVVRVTF
jgi:vacuolar-type H+-ATPase subunit H